MLDRLRRWYRRGDLEVAREEAEARSALERDLLAEGVEERKLDAFVMGGDGYVAPVLPTGTEHEVYEEFERDEHSPVETAP